MSLAHNRLDLTGHKYQFLMVVKYSHTQNKKAYWLCLCDCGNTTIVSSINLRSGAQESCGKCPKNNYYEHQNGYMIGTTTTGKEFMFDKEDYGKVKAYTWHTDNNNYVVSGGKKHKLHRLIMGFPDKLQIDHINHNPLDNRKINMRVCNHQQNRFNSLPRINSSSKYKGVYLIKCKNKYGSNIMLNGTRKFLGVFESESDAALAYNGEALKHFGEFAYLNVIKKAVV